MVPLGQAPDLIGQGLSGQGQDSYLGPLSQGDADAEGSFLVDRSTRTHRLSYPSDCIDPVFRHLWSCGQDVIRTFCHWWKTMREQLT